MKLSQIKPVLKSKGSVPAGKAARVDFGVLGLTMGVDQPTGETSKPAFPMPKYQTISGQTQGTKG